MRTTGRSNVRNAWFPSPIYICSLFLTYSGASVEGKQKAPHNMLSYRIPLYVENPINITSHEKHMNMDAYHKDAYAGHFLTFQHLIMQPKQTF